MIICPAHTSVSLFASAMSCPASIAATVGLIPIIPTMAVTTISASFKDAASISPSIPDTTFIPVSRSLSESPEAAVSSYMATSFGANSRACFSIRSTLVLAVSAVTQSSSGCLLMISSVWVPMEPVDPITVTFFNLTFTSL